MTSHTNFARHRAHLHARQGAGLTANDVAAGNEADVPSALQAHHAEQPLPHFVQLIFGRGRLRIVERDAPPMTTRIYNTAERDEGNR